MSQLVDTSGAPKKIGERGWLGMTWPKKYGGSEGEGVYEYLLNERLAGAGCPQIGKGIGIIGKTLIRQGREKLKQEFLPQILRNDIEFAVGYSEPQAGSDAAAMALKAVRDGDGWRLNGQKIFTTSAHFAEWYWFGARTDPDAPKHAGITLFLMRMDSPGLTIQAMPTSEREITNQVFFDDAG
jgi:alkylation response protein AidB-like acyl-CoA dehydrogenase